VAIREQVRVNTCGCIRSSLHGQLVFCAKAGCMSHIEKGEMVMALVEPARLINLQRDAQPPPPIVKSQ